MVCYILVNATFVLFDLSQIYSQNKGETFRKLGLFAADSVFTQIFRADTTLIKPERGCERKQKIKREKTETERLKRMKERNKQSKKEIKEIKRKKVR